MVLALDGAAIEILKDFSENTPSTLAEVWDALERRFGSINEVQVALRLILAARLNLKHFRSLRPPLRSCISRRTPTQPTNSVIVILNANFKTVS